MRITFEEASRVLAYNSETGELRWLVGVRRMGGKWQARIMTNGKSTCIGVFETAEAASLAYINTKRATHEMGTI